MPKISLAPYALRLRQKWGSKIGPLDAFDYNGNEGLDLYDYILRDLTTLSTQADIDKENASLVRVKQIDASKEDRLIKGKIETGDYGYETDLFNVEKSRLSYRRTTVDAELRPFYFSMHFPTGRDEANLLLERQGNIGVRVSLSQSLKALFSGNFPELILDIQPLVPEDAVEQIFNEGEVKKIRFVRFRLPRDIADVYSGDDHWEGSTELVINARRGRFTQAKAAIADIFNRGQSGGILEVDQGTFDYDTIKLEVQVGKAMRTVDVSHPSRIRAYYDVTADVKLGADGHPTFESIDEAATAMRGDLLTALYGSMVP